MLFDRTVDRDRDKEYDIENPQNSPVFDPLKVTILFGLYTDVMKMLTVRPFIADLENLSVAESMNTRKQELVSFIPFLFKATSTIRQLNSSVKNMI